MEKLSHTVRKMAGLLSHVSRNWRAKTVPAFLIALALAPQLLAAQENANTPSKATLNERPDANYQRIIPLDSPLYREMERLYLLSGKSIPSTSRPWSAEEAAMIFKLLPQSVKSGGNGSMFAESVSLVMDEIATGSDSTGRGKIHFRTKATVNIETYLRAGDERDDWEHGYEERKPLLEVPMEAWLSGSLYSTLDLTIKEEYAAITDIEDNYTNIFSSPTDLDWYFPFRAFISFGGQHWNVQAGRDQANWGAGVTGNLLLSDYSEFYNLLRFTTFWERFKFSAIYIGLDPWLTKEEKEFDEAEADDNGLAGGYHNFAELFKAFLGHRVEFRATEKLTLAVSEAVIFGNKYINLSELNPVFVFHNLFSPEYSNAIFSLEADYTILPGLNTYLQFVMDEFQVPGYEDGGTRPGAQGLLAGFTLVKPARSGYLTFRGESALTDPYLYNRWHPLTRFTNRRRIWSTVLDSYEYINKPLGYEYGPDAVVFYGSAGYEKPGSFSALADIRCKLTGKMNSALDQVDSYDTGKDASSLEILSGTVEKELMTGFHGSMTLPCGIVLSSDIYWINIDDYGNVSGEKFSGIETALSAGITF